MAKNSKKRKISFNFNIKWLIMAGIFYMFVDSWAVKLVHAGVLPESVYLDYIYPCKLFCHDIKEFVSNLF